MLKLSSSSKGSILGTSSFSIMWRIFYSYNHLPLVQQHLLYLHYWPQPPPSWSPSTSTWFFSILLLQLQQLQKLPWWCHIILFMYLRGILESMWVLFVGEDLATVMFGGGTAEIGGTLECIWELFMKEDSTTGMYARKTSEIKRTLENI